MNICLINPNSTESMNQAILQSAKRGAENEDETVQFSILSVPESPPLINSDVDEVKAAYWTLNRAEKLKNTADAFIIACHSDPGVGAVQEATDKPSYGIGASSLLAASRHDGLGAILVISSRSIPRKERLMAKLGLTGRFVSVPTGYREDMSEAEVLNCLLKASGKALRDSRIRSIVLGCAGMGTAASRLREQLPVPVIDGTEEAVRLAIRNFQIQHGF